MKTTLRALALMSLLALTTSAQSKPDFSGDWKMNAARSSFGPLPPPSSMTRKITHVEPALTIIEDQSGDMGQQNTTRKFTTDGKEMSFESQGANVTSSAVWEGATLLVVTNVAAAGLQFIDRMTLSEDGKTMTSAVHITSPQGDVDLKVVFDKQ